MKKWRLWWLWSGFLATTAAAAAPDPGQADLYAQLAFEYAGAGRFAQALEASERARALDPGSVSAWLATARASACTGNDDDAERAFRRALTLAPSQGAVHNNFGRFLLERGRTQAALQHLRQALADPHNRSPQIALVNLGRAERRSGRDDRAIGHFLAALHAAPGYPAALRELSALYLARGSVKLASFYYDRLIEEAGAAGPDDLLLGIDLARRSGDRVREADLAARLREDFPDAGETQLVVERDLKDGTTIRTE